MTDFLEKHPIIGGMRIVFKSKVENSMMLIVLINMLLYVRKLLRLKKYEFRNIQAGYTKIRITISSQFEPTGVWPSGPHRLILPFFPNLF